MDRSDDTEQWCGLAGWLLGVLFAVMALVAVPVNATAASAEDSALVSPGAKPTAAYESYFMAGRDMLAKGQVAEATQMLAADMAIHPKTLLSEIYLSALISQHCFNWDIEVLSNLRPVLPGYVQLLECLGRRYEGSADYKQAEGAYRSWAERHPDNAEPYARLGELFFFTKQYSRALMAFALHRDLVGDSHYAVRRMALSAVGQVTPPYQWVASQWFRENRGHGDIWLPSHWINAAEQGDVNALYNMGMLSLNGWGTTADATVAMGWFRRAAAQGDDRALLQLAVANLTGEGMEQNLQKGFSLTRQTAGRGNSRAYLLLGSLYAYGLGTPPNKVAAITAYNKAAQGFTKKGRSGWLDVVLTAMRGVAPQHPFVIALSEQVGQIASGEVEP